MKVSGFPITVFCNHFPTGKNMCSSSVDRNFYKDSSGYRQFKTKNNFLNVFCKRHCIYHRIGLAFIGSSKRAKKKKRKSYGLNSFAYSILCLNDLTKLSFYMPSNHINYAKNRNSSCRLTGFFFYLIKRRTTEMCRKSNLLCHLLQYQQHWRKL